MEKLISSSGIWAIFGPFRRVMCVTPDESKKTKRKTLKTINMENMFCLIDGNRGIYIPQQFAKNWGDVCTSGMSEFKKDVLLSGPDNGDYWDIWNEVVDNVVFLFDGEKHTLYEDNDLFAVPVN